MRKHLERWCKAAVWGGERVSVAAPGTYSRRFLQSMHHVLVSSEAAAPGCGVSDSGGGAAAAAFK